MIVAGLSIENVRRRKTWRVECVLEIARLHPAFRRSTSVNKIRNRLVLYFEARLQLQNLSGILY
jgi:hypothetical protein